MLKTPSGYWYYNTKTRESTKYRPQKRSAPKLPKTGQPPSQLKAAPDKSDSSAQIVTTPCPLLVSGAAPVGYAKVRAGMKLERNLIASTSLEDKYDIVKVIDPGDGTKGGMNDGIFVVRKKRTNELFIQKNFKCDNDFLISLVRNEINIMRELRCNSLVSISSVTRHQVAP